MSTLFVSGATGFIAQHIVKQLLAENAYVIGTARNQEKADKLVKLFNNDRLTVEIVPDLQTPGAFDEALKKHPQVSVFYHTASPVTFGGKDPKNDILVPAVEGTKNALQAIHKYGPNVKRVVLTSSYAAVGNTLADNPKGTVVTEESWNPITWEQGLQNEQAAYAASKTYAEKTAWEFVATEKPQFSLSAINPTLVYGPQAHDETAKGDLGFSSSLLKSVLSFTPGSTVTPLKGGFIDVRDVAKAHLVAAKSDEIQGKRLILTQSRFTNQLVLNIIREQFPALRGKLTEGNPETARDGLGDLTVDNSLSRKLLGFKFYTIEESVHDTIQQFFDVGVLS